MKFISNKAHGALDYASVYLLFVSPYLFEMSEPASFFTWALAIVHLLLTLTTDFRLGLIRVIPLCLHAKIELVVSLALIGVAIYFLTTGDKPAFYFYLFFSAVLLSVWRFSCYDSATEKNA